jgi:hypothetical protein
MAALASASLYIWRPDVQSSAKHICTVHPRLHLELQRPCAVETEEFETVGLDVCHSAG